MFSLAKFLTNSFFLATLAEAHTVVTYPAWRGNNLITNATFPRGMQWNYPCGGIEPTANRTYWPLGTNGGAVAFQPGWFRGHDQGFIYINIGIGENPENYSFPLTMFHFTGPTENPYPGTICLPQVTLTEDVRARVKNGDKASIQVVEASKHGAAQYNCADIVFTEDLSLVPPVNGSVCFNSSTIRIDEVSFSGPGASSTTTTSLSAAGVTDTGAGAGNKNTGPAEGGANALRGGVLSWGWNLVFVSASVGYLLL